MEIKEIDAKSILTPSKLPDTDYVINPYTGCAFGCIYCYASFMSRYVNKDINDWGNFVFVKVNAAEVLKQDLRKLRNKGKDLTIFISSVTDPYQGLEATYKLTRSCLEVLLEYGFEGNISILTKSHMVLRDMDLFKKIKNIEIGLTITSIEDSISRFFEKKAPNVSQRLEALTELNANGINTYAFVGPLLPHYVSQQANLDKLFQSIKNTGTNDLYIEHINLSNYIFKRLKEELKDVDKEVIEKFYSSKDPKYTQELDLILYQLVEKYTFNLRMNSTLHHNS